ncbi:MAG: DNA glycosylase, partial [Acetanaerobacterium sp.]
MMVISSRSADLICTGVQDFSLHDTLSCGQCFRWEQTLPDTFTGVANGRVLTISQQGGTLVLKDCTAQEFDAFWRDYFDLSRDYAIIKETLGTDAALRRAIDFAPGLRVLRQPAWEALCSFIISQNNNVKRIKG